MDRWEEELAELRGRARRWPAGAVLFHEGDPSDWMLLLRAGRVKVTCSSAGGNETVLYVLGPGEPLGELSVLGERYRAMSATALEPVEGLALPASAFTGVLRSSPVVVVALLRLLGRQVRDAEDKLVEFGSLNTLGRVTRRLVELAERFGADCPAGLRIALPLSQQELAGWTGASRIATARALRTLRDRGWITTGRRQIVIRDLAALRRRVARTSTAPEFRSAG